MIVAVPSKHVMPGPGMHGEIKKPEKDTHITHIHPLDKPDFITHSLHIQQQQRVPREAN